MVIIIAVFISVEPSKLERFNLSEYCYKGTIYRENQMKNFIHESAKIGNDTAIGYNTVILEGAEIGSNCQIGHNVVIHPGSQIGNNVRIDDNTVIGKLPMKAARSAVTEEKKISPAKIGNNVIIGTTVVIYAGCMIDDKVLIADLASIREDVTVGEFTIVGRGVTIENKCSIGKRCKLETEVYITALSTIEDDVFIAPEVTTSNDNFVGRTKERFKHFKGVTIKRGGRIGANATILPGKVIGEDALVAAGAVVTKDVSPRTIVVGSPAKYFRDVPEEQLLENQ